MFVFKPTLKIFLAVCLLAVMLFCSEKNENVMYEKPITQKLDPIFEWLSEESNSNLDNFLPVFYKYYEKTLRENNLEKVARILEIVCNREVRNLSFDDKFIRTVNFFVKNYQSKLPAGKTLFINWYYTNLNIERGDFKTAIDFALKTTSITARDYNTVNEKANAFSDLSYCYHCIGNQNLAIKYSHEALIYFSKIKHIGGIGRVYGSLGGIYSSLNEFPSAVKYYNYAIKYHKKAKDLKNVFIALNNKIIVYENSKNDKLNALVDSTFNYFNKSGLQSKDIKILIYSCYLNNLLQQNKLIEAKKIIEEIEPLVKKLKSQIVNVEFDLVLSEYKIRNNENIDSETILKDLIPYLIKNENYADLKVYYFILKENAIKKSDYQSALLYEEKRNQASEDFSTNTNSNKVIELDKKYQNQKKERQIAMQEKTIAKKNATIAWLALLLLVVFISVVIYQNHQKQKKLKQDKLNAQLYTKQLLEKTEEERKRIASDLHDSVSHELLGLKNVVDGKQAETNLKIDAIINDIRSISRNLHPVMFDKIGLKVSIEQLTERTQTVNDFMVTSEIDYDGLLSNSDELQVYRIIQEALSNVIKYADAMAAKITIVDKYNTVYIEIKDNGKGFNFNEIINSSKSFGLHNIIERSRAIGGEAKFTTNNNGTTVTVEIKKK